MNNIPPLDTDFIINKIILNSTVSFESHNGRISIITFKSTSKIYTVVNAHALINKETEPTKKKVELFWDVSDEMFYKTFDR